MKAINENLLTGERVRDRTRAHVMREGARAHALIGEGNEKVGRKEKESGGVVKREGGNEGRKGNQWKMKVRKMERKGSTK